MYNIHISLEDGKPVSRSKTFQGATELGMTALEYHPDKTLAFIFYQTEVMRQYGQRKLAGLVNRKEVIELLHKPFLYFEIHFETVFGYINNQFCHEPSLLTTCLKLLSFNNKIVSIKPVTQQEFYRKPLHF